MTGCFAVLGAILFSVTAVTFIVFFASWRDAKCCCHAKIKFKRFLKFYEMNPSRWLLYDGYVEIFEPNRNEGSYYFWFGFFDYIRYEFWRKTMEVLSEKEAQRKKEAEVNAYLIDVVKRDIEAYSENIDKMVSREIQKNHPEAKIEETPTEDDEDYLSNIHKFVEEMCM